MKNLKLFNGVTINRLNVLTVKKIVFDAFVEVNPFNLKDHSLPFYGFHSRKFAQKLANVIKLEKDLNVEIIIEILFRSFPVRSITTNEVTNDNIVELAEVIAPEIISRDGKIIESLLIPQSDKSERRGLCER